MLYYFIPDKSIFGGIKVGFQLAEMLNDLGVPCVVATPGALAPQWFASSVPVVSSEWAQQNLEPHDRVMFSLPHDYERLSHLSQDLIFHCNGTDPLIDPILADKSVRHLSCWAQASSYMRARGVEPTEIGISVSDCFFYAGTPKREATACYMSRRGLDIVERTKAENPDIEYCAIEEMNEQQVAQVMQTSSYYLATSEGEWFGLPALEAMAAGCIVVSVPVLGGMEYLENEANCIVTECARMPSALSELTCPETHAERFAMRQRALATAYNYRASLQKQRLRELLRGPLEYLH